MLRLVWKYETFDFGSVVGDAQSIRDLYWSLTQLRKSDAKAINVRVFALNGTEITATVMSDPFAWARSSQFSGYP